MVLFHVLSFNDLSIDLYILGASFSKIRSLKDPMKEMDKSDSNPKSVIYLTDSPDVIVKKIKGAVSDFNSKVFLYYSLDQHETENNHNERFR